MHIEVITNMNIVPLEDRVAVIPYEKESKMGNIMLPEVAQRPANRGLVVAVGPGRCVGVNSDGQLVYTPMGVKIGDTVAFGWNVQPALKPGSMLYSMAGQKIVENGQEYVILRMSELICVVDVNKNYSSKTVDIGEKVE